MSEVRDEGRCDGRGHAEYDVDHQRHLVTATYLEDQPIEEGREPEAEIHEGKEGSEDETEMLRTVTIGGDGGGERGRRCPGGAEHQAVNVEEIPGWQQKQEEEGQAA